jgi:hypothetical protein
MKAKLVLCLVTAGLIMASAKSYSLDLLHPAMLGDTELKAGEYQVELVDQKAVVTKGKLRVENPVTVGTADQKFRATSVVISDSNGKQRIQEIHLGGTTTKLVFAE